MINVIGICKLMSHSSFAFTCEAGEKERSGKNSSSNSLEHSKIFYWNKNIWWEGIYSGNLYQFWYFFINSSTSFPRRGKLLDESLVTFVSNTPRQHSEGGGEGRATQEMFLMSFHFSSRAKDHVSMTWAFWMEKVGSEAWDASNFLLLMRFSAKQSRRQFCKDLKLLTWICKQKILIDAFGNQFYKGRIAWRKLDI